MVDGGPTSDPSQEPAQQQDLPDRLRVHSLARALGTTSKRVVDALAALDGRIRSAHSGVDYEEAIQVRDLLSARPPEELVSAVSLATGATHRIRVRADADRATGLHAVVRRAATDRARPRHQR